MNKGKFYFKFVVLVINKDKNNTLCNSNANKQILKMLSFSIFWFGFVFKVDSFLES